MIDKRSTTNAEQLQPLRLTLMVRREQDRMPYITPLDGIRAIAILAVLLFHVCPAALCGGFTGVDVFFVLSGYLITSIVLHEIHVGAFSLQEFYLRRIQRLLPNVVVTVFGVLLLWSVLLPSGMASEPGRHGLWTLFNLSNVYCLMNLGGYWGNRAEWAPLTHTWSLGVEEQFYLFFPGSLLLLARFQPNRMRLWLSVMTVISFGICLYGTRTHTLSTFYLLPTRVWELLLGAVLAAHRSSVRFQGSKVRLMGLLCDAKAHEAIGWAGLGMIFVGFFTIDGDNGFPGLVSLAPTVGTVLVLLSIADEGTRVSRILSTPFMVGTGKLSYSMYLWHWPLIIFGKLQAEIYGFPQIAGATVGGLVGILLAWWAYVFVERPLRNRGPGRSWRLATIAAGCSIVTLFCITADQRSMVDPEHRFDSASFYSKLYNAGRDTGSLRGVAFSDVYFPPVPPRSDAPWRTGGIIHLYGANHPKVVVLGSSHATMYSRLVDDICREMALSVAFLGVDGTNILLEEQYSNNPNFSSPIEAREFSEACRKWLRAWHPEVVFVIDRWDAVVSTQPDFDVSLRSFFKVVSPMAGHVIFVAQVPVTKLGEMFNLRGFVTWSMSAQKSLPRLATDSREHLRKQAIAAAEAATAYFPNLRVLRPDLTFYRGDGSIRYAEGRSFFYADDDHLTDIGTEQVRALFEKAIAETLSDPSSQHFNEDSQITSSN